MVQAQAKCEAMLSLDEQQRHADYCRDEQQRHNARERIQATMAMVAEMQQTRVRKTCCYAAYMRLAATFAMVEVKGVITLLVQHKEKLKAAQNILPERFTTSDLEAALRKTRREAAAAVTETQSMVQQLISKTRAVEKDASVIQATLRAATAKRMVNNMVSQSAS